jgi:hypothetical protein
MAYDEGMIVIGMYFMMPTVKHGRYSDFGDGHSGEKLPYFWSFASSTLASLGLGGEGLLIRPVSRTVLRAGGPTQSGRPFE